MLLLAGFGALGADALQQDELQLLDLVSFDHCKEVRATRLTLIAVRAAGCTAVCRVSSSADACQARTYKQFCTDSISSNHCGWLRVEAVPTCAALRPPLLYMPAAGTGTPSHRAAGSAAVLNWLSWPAAAISSTPAGRAAAAATPGISWAVCCATPTSQQQLAV
jgi:hypothetical protein